MTLPHASPRSAPPVPPHWTAADIPSQRGRSFVVTGTGGLALEDAIALSRAGGSVVLAGRNEAKGATAVDRVQAEVPEAIVRFEALDLASLPSVAAFAARLAAQQPSLDVLVNNAAVMTPPTRQQTADGFELQFGTNHLGHFALTAGLLPLLRRGANPRVVTLSSIAARDGAIDFDNLQAERGYEPMPAYGQSKLAALLFAFELQRRSDQNRWGIESLAAHPGISRTDMLLNGPGRSSTQARVRTLLWFLFQPAAQGALPALFAATSPAAKGGAYYGPHAFGELRGHPALSKVPPRALDVDVADRLWRVSEQLTSTSFS